MEDFQQSLELKRNQPIAMLYKGLTFFHRGLLKVSPLLGAFLVRCTHLSCFFRCVVMAMVGAAGCAVTICSRS